MSDEQPKPSPRRRVVIVEPPDKSEAAAGATYLSAQAAAAAGRGGPDPSPQDAPDPPDAAAAAEAAGQAPLPPPARPRSGLVRLFALLAGAVLAIAVGLWIDGLYARALAASPALGWAVLGLTGALLLVAALLALREIAAIGRLGRLSALRARAEAARGPGATAAEVDAVVAQLRDLYQGRRDLRWSTDAFWDEVAAGRPSMDRAAARERLDRCEREVLAKLDALAGAEIERAGRRVAAATALMPSALLDAAAALVVNLGMIRRIAEIYGGRASALGSVRLGRRVVAHAMAAGLIEMGGDLLTPLIGGGLAGSASRRLGEGLVNGAMTVRIGLAAADLCRPAPYGPGARPKAAAVAWRALRGFGAGRSRDVEAGSPGGKPG